MKVSALSWANSLLNGISNRVSTPRSSSRVARPFDVLSRNGSRLAWKNWRGCGSKVTTDSGACRSPAIRAASPITAR